MNQRTVSDTPNKKLPITLIMGAFLIIALAVAGYFYYKYQHTSQAADKKEIEDLKKEIGDILILPDGETPTLATVTDKEKLADQAFFQHAENGDKVLIYSNSGKAILYRPSAKKIVDVTTVNVNQPEAGAAPQAEATPPATPTIVRVAILNGAATDTTSAVESQLKTIIPNAAVVTKAQAKNKTYTTTTVVAVNDAAADAAATIAGGLQGGSVGELPAGETAPADADVVIVLGSTGDAQ